MLSEDQLPFLKRELSANEIRLQGFIEEKASLSSKVSMAQDQLNKVNEDFGLREKFFGGYLGGDRDRVLNQRLLTKSIEDLENQLKSINLGIQKIQNENLNTLTTFLIKNDSEFAKTHNGLGIAKGHKKESLKFLNLVKKARQGVVDALVWADWETIINHRDARKHLNDFQNSVKRYQQSVDKYHEDLLIPKKTPKPFLDELNYNSQKAAMASFKKLFTRTKAYISHSEEQVNELRKSIDGSLTEVQNRVSKFTPSDTN